ncbi:MAG: sialate O-acetylesterase [Phycisphaerae bacterium]|nr:sialate O-acetylesterase [Phycisphaerae bacterium]
MKHLLMIALITIFSTSCVCAGEPAKVSLATVFGDNMVLQRDCSVPVWGWAAPGEAVTVEFAGQKVSAKADATGKWKTALAAMPANAKPAIFKVSGSNTITLKNVVVGDVWVCSGQSNMSVTVSRALQPKKEAKAANFPLIRHITVKRLPSNVPLTQFKGSWVECSPRTAPNFTAVGYFFARRLYKELDIPIGLINTSWGGTHIEPWTPSVGFAKIKEQKFAANICKRLELADPTTAVGKAAYTKALADIEAWVDAAKANVAVGKRPPAMPALPFTGSNRKSPTHLYRGMVAPLVPYAIRGVIWYQGESNGGEGMSYYHKKRALVGGWREVWGQGDFPFYWVQLANYHSDRKNPAGGSGYAKTRDAQRKATDIPKTGMAVIIDIGNTSDIHPKNKQDVGDRLAQLALSKEYGKSIVAGGPLYKGHVVEGGKIRVKFDNVGGGLIVGRKEGLSPTRAVPGGKLARFAIAGANKKWVWANAVIDGTSVIVSSPKVAKPVAVRYAYSANPLGANLYNKEGLPASPFRTDRW